MRDPQNLNICSLIILAIINWQCADDNIVNNNEKFVGEWKIAAVLHDEVLQDNWTGATLTFTQISVDSGAYFLPQTPYDSIWNSAGSWKKLSLKETLSREDGIELTYGLTEDHEKMILVFYLPWTQQPTCVDSVCLPNVTGQWTVKLNR